MGRGSNNLRRGSNSEVSDRDDYRYGDDNDTTRHQTGVER